MSNTRRSLASLREEDKRGDGGNCDCTRRCGDTTRPLLLDSFSFFSYLYYASDEFLPVLGDGDEHARVSQRRTARRLLRRRRRRRRRRRLIGVPRRGRYRGGFTQAPRLFPRRLRLGLGESPQRPGDPPR